MSAVADWQPRLVALVCNWCTYAGADMAGMARRTQAPNVRVVRLLCSGRIDPLIIVTAFEQGADGVIVSGCHPGDCHYVQGNLLARRRLTIFSELMDFLGLDRRRLQLAWVSASEGVKWSQVVDEATAAVREAGPLRGFGRPAAGAPPVRFPERPSAPRPAPAPGENEATATALRERAASLLGGGEVAVVAGYAAGSLPGQMVPTFVSDAAGTEVLDWNERCLANLSVYLPELLRRDGRVGMVVKSCDAKAVLGLVREHQIDRDRVVLIGVPCTGVRPDGRLAAKCYPCAEAVSPIADMTAGTAPAGPRAVAPDPRDAEIAALAALPADQRWDFWQGQLGRCLRCYACRAVCPLCYCETCVTDRNRPQWIPVSIDGAGNTAWNVARAMHLAGRCGDCDECARACPADIRLDLVNRRVASVLEARFDYRPERAATAPPPLLTFLPTDPDGFR
ncbi:MAG TPA: hydrogenase iron-sulfur subunit [Candidatus Binatia bacterium]|nr:hydrogenase iron-sulfur subunit [Candidatus Binatia bacterium]